MATLRDVFDHVAVIGPPAASTGRTAATRSSWPAIGHSRVERIAARNAERGDDDVVVGDPAALDDFVDGAEVLTDEHAPVDQLLT